MTRLPHPTHPERDPAWRARALRRGRLRDLALALWLVGVPVLGAGLIGLALLCAGCTRTVATSPSGWSVERTSVLGSLSVDELEYSEDPAGKRVRVSKARSDTTAAIDLAAKALDAAKPTP